MGFEGFEEEGIGDFFAVGSGEAEGIDGRAFLGVDAGVGDGKPELADGGGDKRNRVAVGESSIVGLDCGCCCCWTERIS